jgi:hypothetical protein
MSRKRWLIAIDIDEDDTTGVATAHAVIDTDHGVYVGDGRSEATARHPASVDRLAAAKALTDLAEEIAMAARQ